MWFAYIDESYNARQHWVIAVLVEHENVNAAHRALHDFGEEMEDAFDIDAETELHGYDIFHGVGAFETLNPKPRARVWIYERALATLLACGCKIILRGINKPGLITRYGDNADHPHRIAMAHLIERIDEFCGPRNSHALLVADEHSETQSDLLRDLLTFQEGGTWGYRATQITRVIDTIHFVPSFTNRLIQGAHLAAFVALRQLTHAETNVRSAAAVRRLWDTMQPQVSHRHCWYP